MTLEEAQARILDLETQLQTANAERETLSQNNETLTADLARARELNQKLFDRIPVSNGKQTEEEKDEEEAPTCEEFAKTLNI